MKKLNIQKGDRFGRLNIIEEKYDGTVGRKFFVECDCGAGLVVRLASIKTGKTKSCGCIQKENTSKANTKHGYNKRGETSKIYMVWGSMIARCTNPKDKSYERYGGRGIKVCKRWFKFENFLRDMGEKSNGLSIDRINNDGDYKKTNCRWATASQQMFNRRKFTWRKKNK